MSGLTLSDIERWDPNAIHQVFEAAISRAEGTRAVSNRLGDIMAAVPWEGEAADAAHESMGKIRLDLNTHADACEAVGHAAYVAEAEVAAVKAEWKAIQAFAASNNISIDTQTLEMHGPTPRNAHEAQQIHDAMDKIEADLRQMMDHARAADSDLAAAIRGAIGQESPADIEKSSKIAVSRHPRFR